MLIRPLLFMMVVLILAIAYIYCDALMQEKGVRLSELKTDTATIEKENADLKAEIAQLSSATRIEEIALNELGMVQEEADDIVYYTATNSETKAEEKEENAESYGIFSVFRRVFAGS